MYLQEKQRQFIRLFEKCRETKNFVEMEKFVRENVSAFDFNYFIKFYVNFRKKNSELDINAYLDQIEQDEKNER